MEIVKVTPRISEKTAEELKRVFPSLNAGCEYVLESWLQLYRLTIHKLKGHFSRGELLLMVDVMNGTYLTPGIAGQHLDINVADGISLDKLDEKWSIDGPELNKKIAELTIYEAACMEWWIQAFWNQKEHGNLDEYVEDLA